MVSQMTRRSLVSKAGAVVAAGAVSSNFHAPAILAQEKVTISWLTDLPADTIVPAFHEANPDIEVKVESVSFNEVFQQNQVRLGSGSEEPDVVSVDAPLVASYGLRGWLEPLDDQFPDTSRAEWVDALVESGTYDGKLIAPPIWNSSQLFFYNEDVLVAAGVTPPGPEERWTWTQVQEAAAAVTQDDVFGFQFEQYNRIYQLQPLPQGKGVPVIGDDGLTVEGIINAPEWVEAFDWYQKMHNEWALSPKGTLEIEDLFANQKLIMCVRGPWAITSLSQLDLPFAWKAAPHPIWEGGEIVVPTDSWHLGVNVNSQHKDAAIRFVQFATSLEAGRLWYEAGDSWPMQKVLLQEITDSPENTEWPRLAYPIAARESEFATPRPLTPGYNEYQDILGSAFENMRNGSGAQEELDSAAEKIEREMRKYL
ncbi:MAG TPA: sugar ABC transporter substrate-binding protein [Thermomicrobiales bacterium]|nr:sugar ABC transporter substrate-binding protein [Thermomicrobiales bacterium]